MPRALLLLLLAAVPGQELLRTRDYRLELPEGWRQLLPTEAHQLRHTPGNPVPAELIAPLPAGLLPYGPIPEWLAGRFDGRALELREIDSEPDLDEHGLAFQRAFWEQPAADGGPGARVESARLVEIGQGPHPAIELVVLHRADAGGPPRRSLQFYVPTAGRTLVLAFRAEPADFATAEPVFRACAATLLLARPARGSGGILDQILYAAGVGALLALLIAVLRRRPPPRN